MIRLVVLCTGLILLAPVRTRGAEVVALNPCPRPSDQYGPRYEIVTGTYQSRRLTPGGGKFVLISPKDSATSVSVNVTDEVFDLAGSLTIGTSITLVSYVRNSTSGAQPPYSCIELAH
jgi:hypothetical protein